MPKNKGRGGKNFRKMKHVQENNDLIFKEGPDQVYGKVTNLLGNCRVDVLCYDGVQRQCLIRGNLKKKTWIVKGDTVLVCLRQFEDKKADIVHRYTPEHVNKLKEIGEIEEIKKIEESGGGIEIKDESDEEQEGFEFNIDEI